MHVSDYLQIDPSIFLSTLKCTILNYMFKTHWFKRSVSTPVTHVSWLEIQLCLPGFTFIWVSKSPSDFTTTG